MRDWFWFWVATLMLHSFNASHDIAEKDWGWLACSMFFIVVSLFLMSVDRRKPRT